MKKTVLYCVLLLNGACVYAAESDIELEIKNKLSRICPQSPKHLQRLASVQDLAQKEVARAKAEGRQPSSLVLGVATIPTCHPGKMWERLAELKS